MTECDAQRLVGQPVPSGVRCHECFYSLDGVKQGPCPECGLVIGEREIAIWTDRQAWIDRFPLRRFYFFACAIPFVYAAGAAIFGQHIGPATAALLLTGTTIGGTMIVGEVLAAFAGPHNRKLTRCVWMRYAYLMHLPWLVSALCAGVALTIALFDRLIGGNGDLLAGFTVIGFFVWFVGMLASGIFAWVRLATVRRRHTLRWTTPQIIVMTVALLAQAPAHAVLGFAGGSLAAAGAAHIAGVQKIYGWN